MPRLFHLNVVAKQRAFQRIISRISELASVRLLNTEHLDNCSVYSFEVDGVTPAQMDGIEHDIARLPVVESTHARSVVPS